MAKLAIRMKFEPLRSLGFASIDTDYTAVGGPLSHSARQIFVENLTDVELLFSIDGVTDHFALPTNGYFLSDISSNQVLQQGFYLGVGEQLYVKESGSPTTGSVYFSVIYGLDN